MEEMFILASSFNQDLGWCVDDDVSQDDMFNDTPCESEGCGVVRAS